MLNKIRRGLLRTLLGGKGVLTQSGLVPVEKLLRLTTPDHSPNINEIWRLTKDLDALRLNVKGFGYELARSLQMRLTGPVPQEPEIVNLKSKPATQADVESRWFRYWCGQIKAAPVYHRKLWEFAYTLQTMYETGIMRPGARVLGFGVGAEPIPSYLASLGIDVIATDLPRREMTKLGWRDKTNKTTELDALHHAQIVDAVTFKKHVQFRALDMSAIPSDYTDFDACWSCCSLEHLGTIRKGLDFIINSIKTLRVGGIAIHTTEFNFSNDKETIDNWGTVLFQRRHFEEVTEALRGRGYHVEPLDFHVGSQPIDCFIDVPPYDLEGTDSFKSMWSDGWQSAHLKLCIDGFPSTSFGLIVRRDH